MNGYDCMIPPSTIRSPLGSSSLDVRWPAVQPSTLRDPAHVGHIFNKMYSPRFEVKYTPNHNPYEIRSRYDNSLSMFNDHQRFQALYMEQLYKGANNVMCDEQIRNEHTFSGYDNHIDSKKKDYQSQQHRVPFGELQDCQDPKVALINSREQMQQIAFPPLNGCRSIADDVKWNESNSGIAHLSCKDTENNVCMLTSKSLKVEKTNDLHKPSSDMIEDSISYSCDNKVKKAAIKEKALSDNLPSKLRFNNCNAVENPPENTEKNQAKLDKKKTGDEEDNKATVSCENQERYCDSNSNEKDLEKDTMVTKSSEQNESCDSGLPSYTAMIAKAIIEKNSKSTLADIYDYMEKSFPSLEKRGTGWRNCVRHTLSLNDCFLKLNRPENGRSCNWTIHPSYHESFLRGDYRKKRALRKKARCLPWFDPTMLGGYQTSREHDINHDISQPHGYFRPSVPPLGMWSPPHNYGCLNGQYSSDHLRHFPTSTTSSSEAHRIHAPHGGSYPNYHGHLEPFNCNNTECYCKLSKDRYNIS